MLAIAILVVAQVSQPSLFEGHWRNDIPVNWSAMSWETGIDFEVDGDTVKITRHRVRPRPDGLHPLEPFQRVFVVDGKPRPWLDWGDVVAMWLNPYTLEITLTRGTRQMVTTYFVSEDRDTLTMRYVQPGYTSDQIFYR